MERMGKGQNPMSANTCSMSGIRPAMMELPYPPIQASCRNQRYANLLGVDYCGAVSELSAITQYVNNENRLSCEHCPLARVLLGIAMAEMMHLEKLGELIFLLGGKIDFAARQPDGKEKLWTPAYLTIPENRKAMLRADIEAEKAAICQYRKHISMINDRYVNAVLERIVKDEEYHIMMLQDLMEEKHSME